jgi:tripeptidyl-peptidase I
MKLGLMGVSILVSSGDSGVGCNGSEFSPSFPSSCPYVTSVGATSIPNGGDINSAEVAASFSGGGFSNQYALPDYQKDTMASYYANHNPTNVSSMYNSSKKARGYPDLSANGVNMLIILGGAITTVDGTSASAPIVGSLLTLINEQLALAGKPPVGFINPVIYENQGAFNDITSGSNPNNDCETPGFNAVQGWDPVTGVGAPDYLRLLNVFETVYL